MRAGEQPRRTELGLMPKRLLRTWEQTAFQGLGSS